MSRVWAAELGRMGGALALALFLGLILDRVPLFLFLGLLAYLVWHLLNLRRLEAWLRAGAGYHPPEADGVWGEVFHHIFRLRRRDRARKRRMAALVREFREATTAMPGGAVVLNDDDEILWYNDAAERFLGLVSSTDLGQRIDNLLRSPDFVDYLRRGEHTRALGLVAPTDPDRHLSLQLVPYGSGQRLLLIEDTTRLVRLERMRRDFVANASHELRSPLTVVSGYLEAIQEDPAVRDAWGPALSEMRRQTDRTVGIVEDLLELSRLESVGEEAGREVVDVPSLLASVRDEAAALAGAGQSVELHCESRAGLLGAEAEIASAVRNLVVNAIKYSLEDGRVSIRWWLEAGEPRLSVSDTGIGIAPEHLSRITERFYRVDPGRSRSQGGSGLGLAIVKHVLQRHGARLEVRSNPGRGSEFTCHFPAARCSPGSEMHG